MPELLPRQLDMLRHDFYSINCFSSTDPNPWQHYWHGGYPVHDQQLYYRVVSWNEGVCLNDKIRPLIDFVWQDPTFHYEHGVNTAQILVDKLNAAGFSVEGDDVPRDLSSQVVTVLYFWSHWKLTSFLSPKLGCSCCDSVLWERGTEIFVYNYEYSVGKFNPLWYVHRLSLGFRFRCFYVLPNKHCCCSMRNL